MNTAACYNKSVEGRGHFILPVKQPLLVECPRPSTRLRQTIDSGFLIGATMKLCSMCKQRKEESEFHKNRQSRDGINWLCKKCKRNYDLWRVENQDKVRKYTYEGNSRLRSDVAKFGIDDVIYNQMLEAQGGVCATCGKTNRDGTRLCVDHDHETGEVRGLLCKNCNFALGAIKDNTNVLSKMIAYLMGRKSG